MPSGAPRPHRPNITGNTGAGIPFRCDGPTSLPPSGTRTSKRHDGGAAGSLYRRMFHAQAALQRLFARFPFRLDHCGRLGAVDRDGAARVDRIGLRHCPLYSVICRRHLRLGDLSAGSDELRNVARGRLANGYLSFGVLVGRGGLYLRAKVVEVPEFRRPPPFRSAIPVRLVDDAVRSHWSRPNGWRGNLGSLGTIELSFAAVALYAGRGMYQR